MPHFFLSLFFSPQALREAEASRQLEEARILKEAREKRQREERERRKIDLLALCLLNAQLLYFYYCFYCFVFFIYILPSVVDRQKAEDLQREREQYEREQGPFAFSSFRSKALSKSFFTFYLFFPSLTPLGFLCVRLELLVCSSSHSSLPLNPKQL